VMIAATGLAARHRPPACWPGPAWSSPPPGHQRSCVPARQHRAVRTALPHPAAAADVGRRVHHHHRPPRPGPPHPAGHRRPG
jgi:hypothetical protein